MLKLTVTPSELKMHKLRLSVIIPTYNRPETLERALNSIFIQNQWNIEVIVVNDGSTCSYESLIRNYKEKVKFINLHESKGVSNARNIGVREASGDWILFLDDDDEFKNNYFEKVHETICCSDKNAIGFLWCSIQENYYINNKCNSRRLIKYHGIYGCNRKLLQKAITIGVSYGFALRKDAFFDVGGFDEHFEVGEDTELIIRLISNGYAPKVIPSVGVIKHQHNDGRLSKNFERYSKLRIYERIADKHSLFFLSHPIIYRDFLYWSAKVHYESNDFDSGDNILKTLYGLWHKSPVKIFLLTRNLKAIRKYQLSISI